MIYAIGARTLFRSLSNEYSESPLPRLQIMNERISVYMYIKQRERIRSRLGFDINELTTDVEKDDDNDDGREKFSDFARSNKTSIHNSFVIDFSELNVGNIV